MVVARSVRVRVWVDARAVAGVLAVAMVVVVALAVAVAVAVAVVVAAVQASPARLPWIDSVVRGARVPPTRHRG